MLTVFIALVLLLLLCCSLFPRRKRNFPPGPRPLPVIGTMHVTRDQLHLKAQELAREHGPIVGLKFGSDLSVVLHGAKLIREAFGELTFSGRNALEARGFLLGDKYGILQSTGDIWTEQRRFTLRTLRDFGFGKASMEEMILEEAQECCDWFTKQDGAPVALNRRFSLAVVNSLWRILSGERFDHDDPTLATIFDQLKCTERELIGFTSPFKLALLLFYPKIAKFFSHYSGWKNLEESVKGKTSLFNRIITEHTDSFQEDNPRDFVDMYLMEIQRTQNTASSFHPAIGKNSLRSVISDLFIAGTDTTSVTLNWTVLYLLSHPQVQETAQTELDKVVGRTRLPSLNDRKNLPYIECVIMEALRKSSILPVAVIHSCTEDLQFHGYDLPKGTSISANTYDAHHDPLTWGDPDVFRPERFLNADGTCMQRHESFMPFSVGRRVCLGESLARDTLFLFTCMILHNFTFTLAPGAEKPSLVGRTGHITLQPENYEVCMNVRN